VEWTRKIEIQTEGALVISDAVISGSVKRFELVFNLHPDVRPLIENGAVTLANGAVTLRMRFSPEPPGGAVSFTAGRVFIDFKHSESLRVSVKSSGTEFKLTTEITEI
jgi:hypothetical protein